MRSRDTRSTGAHAHAIVVLMLGVLVAAGAAGAARAQSGGAAASPAPATPGPEPGSLTIVGRVVDANGAAFPRAQVFVEGTGSASAAVGPDGRFVVRVPARGVEELVRSPFALWVRVRRLDWRIELANGEPALRLEARGEIDSAGRPYVEVRSNDSTVTRTLARSIAAGRGLSDTIVTQFRAVAGREPPARDLVMSALQIARPPGPPEAPAAPALDAASPRTAARAPGPDAGANREAERAVLAPRSALAPERRPGSVAPVEAARAPGDSCECRVEGTFEVRSPRPLRSRVRVDVWLDSDPKAVDTIELFMGSPRAFALVARGCRPHRVLYAFRSGPRFARQSPADPRIVCTDSKLRQLRIVLVPSGRD